MKIKRLGSEEIGTTKINSNTEVVIDCGAVILASSSIEDYPLLAEMYVDAMGNERGRSLFYAYDSHDIQFVGESGSVINGNGFSGRIDDRSTSRPGLIRFVNCKNITLKNLALVDSPCWAIQLMNCENVLIENVNIISKWCVCNYGVELISCKNVRISDCVFDTGDACVSIKTLTDNPCEDIVVENCLLSSNFSVLKVGTESYGDFKNIALKNCTVKRAECCAIEIVPTDGGNVNGVVVDGLQIKSGTGPVFIANGTRNASYMGNDVLDKHSSISNILIKNITADIHLSGSQLYGGRCGDCVLVSGTKSTKIKNVVIEDCFFNMPGGRTKDETYSIQELTNEYPEYYILGVAPASGIFVRHADGVQIKNVNIELKEEDNRQKIVFKDVVNYVLD